MPAGRAESAEGYNATSQSSLSRFLSLFLSFDVLCTRSFFCSSSAKLLHRVKITKCLFSRRGAETLRKASSKPSTSHDLVNKPRLFLPLPYLLFPLRQALCARMLMLFASLLAHKSLCVHCGESLSTTVKLLYHSFSTDGNWENRHQSPNSNPSTKNNPGSIAVCQCHNMNPTPASKKLISIMVVVTCWWLYPV